MIYRYNFFWETEDKGLETLTSLETSNVGRHKIIMSIKILGIITVVLEVSC